MVSFGVERISSISIRFITYEGSNDPSVREMSLMLSHKQTWSPGIILPLSLTQLSLDYCKPVNDSVRENIANLA